MPLEANQLAKLIESQAGCLRLWVRSRCASDEDVVQEAFCRLAMQEPPPDNPVAWLYRVCRNLAEKQRLSDARRRQREVARSKLELAAVDPAGPLEIQEMLAAVESLEQEQREVLIARVWGQLSLEEVGNLCGVSTATAFRRYEAALQALRLRLNSKSEKQS
jgi:RNA polymerase sigma-70 factor (ECF subfamily)